MTLTPAYGRDYKSKKEVQEAFFSDADFVIASYGPHMGSCANHSDLIGNEPVVNIRYGKLRKVCVIHLPMDEEQRGV